MENYAGSWDHPQTMVHVSDVKPRLTKEQQEILERHFSFNSKPSTQTKKGFADTLGVPLDKINVRHHNLMSIVALLIMGLELVSKPTSEGQAGCEEARQCTGIVATASLY